MISALKWLESLTLVAGKEKSLKGKKKLDEINDRAVPRFRKQLLNTSLEAVGGLS